MPTSFYIRQKGEKALVYMVVTMRSIRYRRTTDIRIEPERWNANTQSVRELKGYSPAKPLNTRLKELYNAAEALCDKLMGEVGMPTADEFWAMLFRSLDGETRKQPTTFVEYFAEYVERRGRKAPENTMKQYRTTLRLLREYEARHRTSLRFSDITLRFYQQFQQDMESDGYSFNYFGSIIKCIKVAYREAREVDRLHDLHETERRGFSAANVAAKTIYLSVEELQRIADVEISRDTIVATYPERAKLSEGNMRRMVEGLDLARKKFLLGAFTALRVSDFNRLSDIHIQDKFFRITTAKTGAAVVIPIHPVIRKLIDDGFDISTPIAEQKINGHIKMVARIAGITQKVEGTKLVDHRAVVGYWDKCDLVTTHTARRSAATNMYKAGIPTISIMKITGHTTEKSFMKYIKISAEENAELMAKSAFFGGE